MGYYRGGDNCYGRGDYYRGDYYRGDLFSAIGKGLKSIAKGAISLLPGPIGSVARAATGIGRGSIAVGPSGTLGGMPTIGYLAPPGGTLGGMPMDPFGPLQGPVGTMTPQGFVQGCQLKGTRPNKSGYYKQARKGDPSSAVFIPKGSVCVKPRRLNVANPRALRRAIRRAQGFSKLARRVLTFTSPKPPKGRGVFKKRK